MNRHLLSLILFFCYLLSNAQTPCTPVPNSAGETCANPCWVCLNPYFGNTFNFQGNGASPSNFCPPNTTLNNDQYFLFVPTCFELGQSLLQLLPTLDAKFKLRFTKLVSVIPYL